MECESKNLEVENYVDEKMENGKVEKHINGSLDKENANPNAEKKATQRRHDEPSELSFEIFPENAEEKIKRQQIEKALEKDSNTTLEQWRLFARSEYGLINDDLRQKVWPLLVSVDVTQCDPVPTLEELMSHPEYNQVVLDVNRSLKRFPPSIAPAKRLALQDQLTAIILRVISKYPHLSYYQVRFSFY
ncbi:hypothetical protein ACKWTF_000549 [Chironomus riparius]